MTVEHPRKPLRHRVIAGAIIVSSLALAGGWLFVGRPAANDAKTTAATNDRPVMVRKAHFATLTTPRILVGTLRARVEGDQGFRVSGKIAARHVQPGDRVKAGALIATLDSTDLRLQRESAEAELSAATSSERQAQHELQRVLDLRARGWSTEQGLDRQKAALDEATGRRMRAERSVEIARNAQSYSELRAETDGIVTALYIEAGQVVAAGSAVARLARDGDREAQVALPEHELPLARGAGASVALWSNPDRVHGARLREISPNADPATRTFQARYVVEGLPADAPLGMTVSLSLTAGASNPVARLPIAAILNEGGGTEVFVVDPATGELRRRPVRVHAYDAQDALVASGINEGDAIVIMGVHKLRPGQKVRVMTSMPVS